MNPLFQRQFYCDPKLSPSTIASPPYLRKKINLRKIKKARAYVSALGSFEMYINGERVGEDSFTPGWTDYRKRVHYMTYDVSDYFKPGDNAIGAILGNGWYCGNMLMNKPDRFGYYPKFLLQIEIVMTDGSKELIVSDGSWKTTTGPILMSDHYDGEIYDARKELGAWSTSDYDESAWQSVAEDKLDSTITLCAKPNPPIRKIEILEPVGIIEAPGGTIFDFGQNIVGWARINIPSVEGQKITLKFSESLDENGTFYTQNYRKAKSTDIYICKGSSNESWEPKFTFHGFRYVLLTGMKPGQKPDKSWVTGVVLHNDMQHTGNFSASFFKLNQLQKNIRWGQKGNFFAVPTDCPQRNERLGWTGDAQVFCNTACYNYNTLAFFEKWCADMRDSQLDNGGIPRVVPQVSNRNRIPVPGWGDAGVIVPWEVYQHFGYKRILEDNYEMMKGWVRFYRSITANNGFIWQDQSGYADWLQPFPKSKESDSARKGDTPETLIGTAYFARSAFFMSKAAKALNKVEDVAEYSSLFEQIKTAFVKTFFDAEGKLKPGESPIPTQTAYLLALHFDLLPDRMRHRALEELKHLIINEADGHLRTGFLGTPILCSTLARFGETDLAYSILMKETYPSWLFSINQGATTIWERWDSYSKASGYNKDGMNSLNHYAYGAIGQWMYETIGGLSKIEPGYRKILIAPRPGGGLTHASAQLMTPFGLAKSSWKLDAGFMVVEVTIPPNSTGILDLSGEKLLDLGSGKHKFKIKCKNF